MERIGSPSAEQIAYCTRHVPPHSPFVILSTADDRRFMQATPAGNGYRVEFREGARRRYAVLAPDPAVALLQAFGRDDGTTVAAAPWHRLTVFNDPYSSAPLLVLLLLAVAACVADALRG